MCATCIKRVTLNEKASFAQQRLGTVLEIMLAFPTLCERVETTWGFQNNLTQSGRQT